MKQRLFHLERWAISVDGIQMPGFGSKDEVQRMIDRDPELKKKGAVAVRLKDQEQSWSDPVFDGTGLA